VKQRAVLVPMIQEILSTRKCVELMNLLEEHTVPCAPIYDMKGVFNDRRCSIASIPSNWRMP